MSRLSVISVRVFCQPCSLSNLPHVFSITLFVFSNSSHLEPCLVCLVPCVFKPQSVQTQAIRTLINFQCRDPSKPVNLRFLYQHPFGFWSLPFPFDYPHIWFLVLDISSVPVYDSCLPLCTLLYRIYGFGLLTILLFVIFVLWISDLCLNKQWFLHSPWSASGSSPERHSNKFWLRAGIIANKLKDQIASIKCYFCTENKNKKYKKQLRLQGNFFGCHWGDQGWRTGRHSSQFGCLGQLGHR